MHAVRLATVHDFQRHTLDVCNLRMRSVHRNHPEVRMDWVYWVIIVIAVLVVGFVGFVVVQRRRRAGGIVVERRDRNE